MRRIPEYWYFRGSQQRLLRILFVHRQVEAVPVVLGGVIGMFLVILLPSPNCVLEIWMPIQVLQQPPRIEYVNYRAVRNRLRLSSHCKVQCDQSAVCPIEDAG